MTEETYPGPINTGSIDEYASAGVPILPSIGHWRWGIDLSNSGDSSCQMLAKMENGLMSIYEVPMDFGAIASIRERRGRIVVTTESGITMIMRAFDFRV